MLLSFPSGNAPGAAGNQVTSISSSELRKGRYRHLNGLLP